MLRIPYNATVSQVLDGLDLQYNDMTDISQLKQTLRLLCCEQYDDSYQPITVAVDLLLTPVDFLASTMPSKFLVYQLLVQFREALLSEEPLSLTFRKLMRESETPVNFSQKAALERLYFYLERSELLIKTSLLIKHQPTLQELGATRKPAMRHQPHAASEALVDIDQRRAERADAKGALGVKATELQQIEAAMMRKEDKYGPFMRQAIQKRKQLLQKQKEDAAHENQLMSGEDVFSKKLSEIYIEELQYKQDEKQVLAEALKMSITSLDNVARAKLESQKGKRK